MAVVEKKAELWRLDKLLAHCTGLSRTDVQKLIRKGEVVFDGTALKKPEYKLPTGSEVVVSGRRMVLSEFSYLMLHKPAGYLSASRDKHAPTVLDLVPEALRRKTLFVSGRLDRDTEGLLIITDDGDFSHRLLSPKNKVPKTYYAELSEPVPEAAVALFAEGMDFADGSVATPALLEIAEGSRAAHVTIYEGFYHQVKRMFLRYGTEVTYLKRVKIGHLPLDPLLEKGYCRPLTAEELRLIEGRE